MNGDIVNATMQLPLDSDEFTRAVAERLREHKDRITVNHIASFCGLTTQAVSGWLKGATPPGGLITIKLAHLLQLIGVDSPELDLLQEEQPLNAFVCRMLAFGTIDIEEAQLICGGVGVQAVYKACRGSGTSTPFGTYTNEPPDHTALLSAANLLSSGGTTVPKCFRKISGYSLSAWSVPMKTTPIFDSSSRTEW